MRILVVDDDAQILRALRINLRARGFDVEVAGTGRDALRLAAATQPQLVVLDLGLPDLDGMEVLTGLRGWSDVPVIVLSGRVGGPDKVAALEAGADDYLTKPFGMEELIARIRAISRRQGGPGPNGPAGPLRLGDVVIDLATTKVVRQTHDGEEAIRLTPTEWALLTALARHPGALLSQRQLLTTVWGEAYVNQPANLRLYITQLRRKLEPEPAHPRYLLTEPGMGYRFQPDP